MERWKILGKNLVSCSGILGAKEFSWQIRKWYREKEIKICSKGFHCSRRIVDAVKFYPPVIIALVECCGDNQSDHEKEVWSEMRIVKAYQLKHFDMSCLAFYAARIAAEYYPASDSSEHLPLIQESVDLLKRYIATKDELIRSRMMFLISNIHIKSFTAFNASKFEAHLILETILSAMKSIIVNDIDEAALYSQYSITRFMNLGNNDAVNRLEDIVVKHILKLKEMEIAI